jgi:hypothetical protein
MTFTPLRVRISGYICLTGDSLKDSSGALTNPARAYTCRRAADSVTILTYCVCRAVLSNTADSLRRRAIISAILSLEPDSVVFYHDLFRTSSASFRALPLDLAAEHLFKAIDSTVALDSGSRMINAFKHGYRFHGVSQIYNYPLAPRFNDTSLYSPMDTSVQMLDSVSVNAYLYYFFQTPSESLMTTAFKWSYAYPSPDTVRDFPNVFSEKIWADDTLKNGFRLPTVAEWNSIASCGLNITYSTYNGNLGPLCAVAGGLGASSPVASLKPNPWGLYDLTGNLGEWTNDWWSNYGDYAFILPNGRPDSLKGPFKTVKGGSFKNTSADSALIIGFNSSDLPDSTGGSTIGFRMVAPVAVYWDSLPQP